LDLNHYNSVLSQFLSSRDKHPEEPGRKVPVDTDQLPLGGVKLVDAAIMVFDIAGSKRSLEKLGHQKYVKWLGIALHCFFHCVDDYKGTVDKYTGDGAMISFSIGSKEQRCVNAKECAIKISQILYKIINPYFEKKSYEIMNVRIGIDYGPIRIEKVGKKGRTQLVILGVSANSAKELEEWGKKLEFDQYTTVCFGYDLVKTIPKRYISNQNGNLYRKIGTLNYVSSVDRTSPYNAYEYFARIRD